MRIIVTALLLLALTHSAWGQNLSFDDPPKLYVRKQPPTQKELDERESLYQYVFGLTCAQEDRLAEALKAFEEAARLDPAAPAFVKAQAPILVGLGRYDDALAACTKAVELDPDDYSTWYMRAKLFKTLLKYPEAIDSFQNGLKSAAIRERPEAEALFHGELGGLYETTEKFGRAADAYSREAALLEHPDRIAAQVHIARDAVLTRAAEAYEKIGQLYRQAKQYPEAIVALKKAQERAPERSARVSFTLAKVCEEQGDFKQALAQVDVYLRTQPLSTEPHELKIRLLRRLKQEDAIVPWLEKAAGRERFNNYLQLLLAQECVAAKQLDKAEAVYQKLVADSPSAETYRGLFNIYKAEGDAGMARVLAMLDKVMDKAAREAGPTPIGTVQHARAMVGALRADGDLAQKLVAAAFRRKSSPDEWNFDTVLFLAALADQQRKNEEAEHFYRRALSAKEIGPANEAAIYSGLIRVLGNARKFEAVEKVCLDGLDKSRSLKASYFRKELARAQASLQHYDDALQSLERGRKEAGDGNRLLFDLMRLRILIAADRPADAETECHAFLKTYDKPNEIVELRYLLSSILSAEKKQDQAEEQLQLILKIDPDNATVNNDLGYLWADQGKKLRSAEEMIRKALEVDRMQRRRHPDFNPEEDKDNAAYVDSLGWVLFRRGQFDAARQALERAVALDGGDDPTIHDHLGDVYDRLKMRLEASRAWRKALELYNQGKRGKDDERVRAIRRKLESN